MSCRGQENAEMANNEVINNPFVLSTLGLLYTRKEECEKALEFLNNAIEIDPFHAEAYWFRHEAYEAKGDYAKSRDEQKIASDFQYKPIFWLFDRKAE